MLNGLTLRNFGWEYASEKVGVGKLMFSTIFRLLALPRRCGLLSWGIRWMNVCCGKSAGRSDQTTGLQQYDDKRALQNPVGYFFLSWQTMWLVNASLPLRRQICIGSAHATETSGLCATQYIMSGSYKKNQNLELLEAI